MDSKPHGTGVRKVFTACQVHGQLNNSSYISRSGGIGWVRNKPVAESAVAGSTPNNGALVQSSRSIELVWPLSADLPVGACIGNRNRVDAKQYGISIKDSGATAGALQGDYKHNNPVHLSKIASGRGKGRMQKSSIIQAPTAGIAHTVEIPVNV